MPGSIPTRLGKYTLLKPLAKGGMAELFLARADGIEGFSKLVVLKRILPHKAAEEKYVKMFLAEARLVATLDHPNIAHVYDIGIDRDEYFFAMEYVHGQDVRKIQAHTLERRLRTEHALHIAIGVCAGLHFAHEATGPDGRSLNIVHRDVSPHNVLVSYDGTVKLVDFGVAKANTVTAETRDGMIKGKYGYLSPEQALAEQLDRRSDVFALGILLWEMTVGRRLYKIDGELATLQRIVYVDAPRPSQYIRDYPPDLEEIVMKALARDRGQRYQTAQELQVALELYAANHRLVVSSVSMSQEMQLLFRSQIEAWKQAERAGRSLADHVVDIVDEDVISESNTSDGPKVGRLSEVLDALGTSATPAPVTGSSKSKPNVSAQSISHTLHIPPAPAPAPARSRAWIAVALLAFVVAGGAAAYMISRGGQDVAVAKRPAADAAVSMAEVVMFDAAPVAEAPPAPDAPAPSPHAPASGQVAVAPVAPPDAASAPEVTPEVTSEGSDGSAAGSADGSADDPRVPHKTVKRPTATKQRPGGRHPRDGATPDAAVTVTDDKEPPPDAKDPPPEVKDVKPPPAQGSVHAGSAAPVGPPPGTMDAPKVRAVVKAHLGEVETCVERARMDDRDLAGKITLRIDVSGTGQVTHARVAAATVENHGLQDCLVRTVSSWTFPAPAGGVAGAFSYPFTF